jgi:transcriptional antiterminator NusG
MLWYAVHTLSGFEEKAREALEQRVKQHGLAPRFGRILIPSETVIDPKTRRKLTRKFFPGYMLVQMHLDNETWYLVQDTPKITGFVGGGRVGGRAGPTRNPPPVPEDEVARITQMLDHEDAPKPVLDFSVGEEVRLTEGRYASMRGTVEEINHGRGKLRVVINMFGRPVPTELSFHQVEKLS